ncbi:MAG: guanylate kinase [Pseudomonadota bacterium]|jgi:guanylate kinase
MTSGNLFILTAPSGAGKTTLVHHLLAQDAGIEKSISTTTRAPRPGETDGQDYHFVDVDRFARMRDAGEFLEWAEVHGNFYGTSRKWLESRIAAGRDVLLEIDWQGAQQVRARFPGAVGIFILPPSVEELERRLTARGQDSADVIHRRVLGARDEMRHVGEFDYVIINRQLEEAVADLAAVVRTRRLTLAQQRTAEPDFFRALIQD